LVRAGRGLWADSLTVLNYHRIGDVSQDGFDTFKPTVSASAEGFAAQMDYTLRWFNAVSLGDVVRWLDGQAKLPPHAALITFDDGYLDNYTLAYPILRERNLPAAIFLTTGHIEQDVPFYWELLAYCFYHTGRDAITFPNGAQMQWKDAAERNRVAMDLAESLKVLPEDEKAAWVSRLASTLDVSVPGGFFRNLMMTWEQVREMSRGGIEFGGHTVRHPILSRVSLERAGAEISDSKARVERELGKPVLGFAYPNGGRVDFNREIEKLAEQAGYRTAFSLINGPTSLREIKRNPFAIRRIFISHRHSIHEFAVLTNWVNRYRRD
jgi:peptidoglycan/xylan/chitin deacetylase (PgdA/CDA1 family)